MIWFWLVISLLPILTTFVVTPMLPRILHRRRRFQFSLRTLFIVIALVAILLSVATSWRYLHTAKTEWLALASPAVQQLWAEPVVIETDEGYVGTYRSKRRHVDELNRLSREIRLLFPKSSHSLQTNRQVQEIRLRSNDRTALEAWLSAYEEADVLLAGQFVIRGLVEDRQGRPVKDAYVNLSGPYVFINYTRTRSDGTFTMPLKAPPGGAYWLKIRENYGKVNQTPKFSLASDEPERIVRIRLR